MNFKRLIKSKPAPAPAPAISIEKELEDTAKNHKRLVAEILSKMEPAGKKSDLVSVPNEYDVRIGTAGPNLKKGRKTHVIMKLAEVRGAKFYLLGDGRIVNAKYCVHLADLNIPALL